jgi:glucose-1-phosphate adenylyltransferase
MSCITIRVSLIATIRNDNLFRDDGRTMHDVLVLILGGGRGARLFPLTKHRSEPAVPIAGKYRLIDIPISNCLNSGLRRIYVLTQYMSVSLHRHIANTYKFTPFSRGFVEVLAAQQTNERSEWFRGTADALRQNLRYIQTESTRDMVILYGDQLYRMDFQKVLAEHRRTEADVTLAVTPVTRAQAGQYGIVYIDRDNRITNLVEKPRTADQLDALRLPPDWLRRHGFGADRGEYLANMGIYFHRRGSLLDLLERFPNAHDLVTEILAPSFATYRIQAHLFDGYWQDVGSVRTYYEANLTLTGDHPPFDFHQPDGVIYTHTRNLPASRILDAGVDESLVSDGCVVETGAKLQRCVIGVRSHIGRDVRLRDVVMLGANYYESEAPPDNAIGHLRPRLGVGDGSVLQRVILDKNCRIGRNVQIVNHRNLATADGDNYYIRDGIVIIPDSAIVPDGAVI